ncbi:MAG: hypothetical protein ABIU05_04745 [Nitrospirales bacterium]
MPLLALLLLLLPISGQAEYLGELSEHPYAPDSTANPFGAGSPFKPDGINNPFSPYSSSHARCWDSRIFMRPNGP